MKPIPNRLFATIVCALLFFATEPIATQADTLVVPPSDANQEADGFLLGYDVSGMRTQTVYDSSLFLDAMPSGGIITEVAYRVEGHFGNAVDGVVPDLEIRVSTTTTMEPSSSMIPYYTFSANVGSDETVVFPRGPLHLESTWSPTGPNPFSLRIPLATPFTYDPRKGNLLIEDFVYQEFFGRLTFDLADAHWVRSVGGVIGDPQAVIEGGGPVMQVTFTPIPEPLTGLLVLAGMFISLAHRLRACFKSSLGKICLVL